MVKVTQNSFLGGQLDFEMMGRQDFDLYSKGASKLVNFNLIKRGAISKRQGFDRILDLERIGITSGKKVRAVPFAYSKGKGFVLLFSEGTCHAVAIVEGFVHREWEVPYEDAFSEDELDSFDYQQCGYRLYIACQTRHPSVIEASDVDIDRAIADITAPSPFVWKYFDVGGHEDGMPSISGFLQTRIRPSADTEGGLVTEKYRVSAVFEDKETFACQEAYNTSYLGAYTLGTMDGDPVTSISTSQTGVSTSYTNKNNVSYTGASTTKTTTVGDKVKGTTKGTSYLAPWVESQTIDVNINVNEDSRGRHPNEIRVYKKTKGYYGLIGTVRELSGDTDQTLADGGMFDGTPVELRSEKISESASERQYDDLPNAKCKIDEMPSAFTGGRLGGWSIFGSENKIVINPEGAFDASGAKLLLALDAVVVNHTAWSDNSYKRPLQGEVKFISNKADSISISVYVEYNTTPGSQAQTYIVEHTFDGLSAGDDFTNDEISVTKYTEFSAKRKLVLSNFLANESFRGNGTAEIDLAFVEDAVLDIEPDATRIRISKIEVWREAGESTAAGGEVVETSAVQDTPLVVNGVAVSVKSYKSSVKFTDNNIIPDDSITPYDDKAEQPFRSPREYPACVTLSQQRLIWASSKAHPERIWMSEIGDFTVYTEHEVQTDSDSIQFDLPVTRFAKLNHLVEMRSLLAFNDACEWLIDSTSAVSGLTYETIRARPQSYTGSNSRLKPIVCGNSVLFCERTGQAVRRFGYVIDEDGYAGRDVSVVSSSIFEKNNIVDWTYQQFPNSVTWCVLDDGTMASFTFMPEQNTSAWGTHVFGDGTTKVKAITTSFAVAPSLQDVRDGDEDKYRLATHQEVFAITEDADGRMWLERMRVRADDGETVYNALTLDSMRVVMDAAPYDKDDNPDGFIEAEGLRYYRADTGEMITREEAEEIVGDAERPQEERRVYEGYPVQGLITTVYPVVGKDVGTGQFDVKDVVNVGLRLQASADGEVCSSHWLDKDAEKERREPIRYDDDLDHDKSVTVENGRVRLHNCDCANVKPYGFNCRDGRVTITQGTQWPFTLLAIETDIAVETEGQ